MKRSVKKAQAKAKPRGKHKGRSKYAAKVARGNQMYGPHCCANTNIAKERT